ncbi:MAG: GNAT family N-acetyltransferase [Thermodesulfobacteriota bacterium]|nr:GNAT family N-acetyltransferase [Thermodesulfobacteriota bacterium]
MTDTIETQMLDALELFHYASQFRDHQFILVLEDDVSLEEIMLDIRMLYSAQIKIVILYSVNQKVGDYLDCWSKRGFRLHHSASKTPEQALDLLLKEPDCVAGAVVGLDLTLCQQPEALTSQSLLIAKKMGVDKVFFLGTQKGLTLDEKFLSHPRPSELERYLDQGRSLNIVPSKLRLMVETTQRTGIEVIILAGKSGTLFEEVFTHRGSGTLLTEDYPNVIRQGSDSDLTDLLMLIKHGMEQGSILPVAEEAIATNIHNYFVYTVNNSIVASATLVDYGDTAELAKFCTLPRYQGKGRARQLALQMIETAAELKKDSVFALSVNPKMWDFFLGLGFDETSRGELPELWQTQYDFSRPSKAFMRRL